LDSARTFQFPLPALYQLSTVPVIFFFFLLCCGYIVEFSIAFFCSRTQPSPTQSTSQTSTHTHTNTPMYVHTHIVCSPLCADIVRPFYIVSLGSIFPFCRHCCCNFNEAAACGKRLQVARAIGATCAFYASFLCGCVCVCVCC